MKKDDDEERRRKTRKGVKLTKDGVGCKMWSKKG
jgi:hypothetical protein